MLNDSAPPPKYAMSLSKALFSASTLLGRVLRARVMASPAGIYVKLDNILKLFFLYRK